MVTISIAVRAASAPRLCLAGSARSMACATVLVVNTPNTTGRSHSKADLRDTPAGLGADVVEMRRLPLGSPPPDRQPHRTGRFAPRLAPPKGISKAPGTRTTSSASSIAPAFFNVSTAAANSRLVTNLLNLLTTMPTRNPVASCVPLRISFVFEISVEIVVSVAPGKVVITRKDHVNSYPFTLEFIFSLHQTFFSRCARVYFSVRRYRSFAARGAISIGTRSTTFRP